MVVRYSPTVTTPPPKTAAKFSDSPDPDPLAPKKIPQNKRITVEVSPSTHAAFKFYCLSNNTTTSALLRIMIEKELAADLPSDPAHPDHPDHPDHPARRGRAI